MKFLACLLATSLSSACVIHVHVHQDPKSVADAGNVHDRRDSRVEDRITGVVRDANGEPIEARVALVGGAGRGSSTMGTGKDGRFDLRAIQSGELALHASTKDGRSAVARVRSGAREVELVVRPGATFLVELGGRGKARLAVFADGLCIEDFTLVSGDPANIVVPAGEVRFRIYDGETVFEEQRVTAKVGDAGKIWMQSQS